MGLLIFSINITLDGCVDPRLQAVSQTAPSPMVRSAARLHRHHRAGRLLGQPRTEGITAQIPPPQHPPGATHRARRKHALRQIHADSYSAHGNFLFC